MAVMVLGINELRRTIWLDDIQSLHDLHQTQTPTAQRRFRNNIVLDSVNIPKVRILLIRQILEGMQHAIVLGLRDASSGDGIPPGVLTLEVPAKHDNDHDEEAVTAQVRGESDEVSRSVPGEEDLGT